MTALIQIRKLHKYYGAFAALQDIDLNVMTGEVMVIVGPSGSGKSTLIRCINLLEEYQQGEVRVDGQKVVRGSGLAKQKSAWCFRTSTCFPI
jgi:general L-amino acid transport system ATP-binding protein